MLGYFQRCQPKQIKIRDVAKFTFFHPKICCSKYRYSNKIVKLHQISKTFSSKFLVSAKIYQKDEIYVLLYVLSRRLCDSDGRVGDSVYMYIRRLRDNLGELA